MCFLTGVVEPDFCVQVPKPLKFLRPHYSTLTEHYAKVAPDCVRQYQKADDPVLPCNAVMTFDTFYLILPNREEQQKDQQRSRNNKDAESAKQGGTLCVFLSFFPSCMSLWIGVKVQNPCLCRCLLATWSGFLRMSFRFCQRQCKKRGRNLSMAIINDAYMWISLMAWAYVTIRLLPFQRCAKVTTSTEIQAGRYQRGADKLGFDPKTLRWSHVLW